MNRQDAIKDLMRVPGIGKRMAEHFLGIGITSVAQFKNKEPEYYYKLLERKEGKHVDRCVLYQLRCAQYFASRKKHNPELLKWWNWKDKK